MLESTEVRLSTGRVLSKVTNRYLSKLTTTGDPVPVFPYVSSSVAERFDLFSGGLLSTTTTTNTVNNQFGNIDETTVRIRDVDGTLVHETHTVNVHTNNPTDWRLGRLRRSDVTRASDQQTLTRAANFGYDDGATDLLSGETVQTGTAFALPKQYERDLFGNVTKETVSVSATEDRITEATYNANGRFPETVENAAGHIETYGYNPYHGGIQRLTGPNLLETLWTYDALGRKASEVRADDTATNISYAWCVDCPSTTAVYKITTTSTGAPTVTEYFDSLNRNVLTQTESFDGRPSNVLTQYTPRGEVLRVSRPYYPGTPVFLTEYDYDILGRVISEDPPDPGSTAIAYTGLTTTTSRTVSKSFGITRTQITSETKNARGLTTETVQVNEGIITEYRYDPAGNLLEVEDSAGNLTTNIYDVRGHKRQTIDPDMGHWFYDYNALGELVEQKDAKNQITKFLYDKLGRLKERQEPEGSKTRITTWVYDTATKGIGKLASETSRLGTSGSIDFQRTYTYDGFSRPASTVTKIGGTSYGTSLSYDASSRVEVITYPANGFAVRNLYNAQGYLREVQKANTPSLIYWRAESVNAEGQVTQDADAAAETGILVGRDYDPTSGRLRSVVAGGGSIQNLQYTFDTLGNLEQRVDEVDPTNVLVETFGYDDVNRLTGIDTDISGITLSKTVGYDDLGNIINKSDVGIYSYDPTRPHAVATAGGNSYSYDANGNVFTGAGRTLTWNSANLPTQITRGSSTLSFSYGPDRSRYKQVASVGGVTETTHYVGGLYEKIVKSGVTTHRHYIQAGQEAVAVQINRSSGDTSTLRYLFRDHLGSIEAITDRAGVVKERFSYDAWGQRRMVRPTDALTSTLLPYGFTNHEHLDSVGLIHMNGRVYDPILSRFVSADPFVQFPGNGQSLNRYSYVLNNPLSLTDPSGLLFDILDPFEEVVDFVDDVAGDVGQFVADNPRLIVGVAVGVLTGGAAFTALGETALAGVAAGAVGGFTGGLIASGGDLETALVGGLTGAAFGFLAGYGPIANARLLPRIVIHGLVGGTTAELQGGRFDQGFLAAGATEALAPVGNAPGNTVAAGLQRASSRAVIGGTVSELSGGKFVNGAATASFASLIGDLSQGRLSESSTAGEIFRGIAVGALGKL